VYEPERPITGRSGWKLSLVDNDDNPARHFAGWLATGYFHPNDAKDMLEIAEAWGRQGASMQDFRAGMIAIGIGQDFHAGSIGITELIARVRREAGDPSNDGTARPDPEETWSPPDCIILPLC